MKIKYLRFKNWLLVTLMSILGLSACKSSKDMPKQERDHHRRPRNEIMLMYGVPPTDYIEMERAKTQDSLSSSQNISQDPVPSDEPRNEAVAMYGVPTVDYKLKGRVIDAKGRPVKGAQVLLLNSNIDADADHLPTNEFWSEEIKRISDTTDAQGNFEVRTSDTPWQQPRILVRDIDGKENGLFRNEILPIDYSDVESSEKGKGWYQGEKQKTDVVIQVKEK